MNRAVAIAAVAGMVVGAGAVIAVRPAAVVKSRLEKTTSPTEKVANCRWWSKKLTEQQIHAIATQIVSTNAGRVLWLDDTGTASPDTLRVGKRKIYIEITGNKRPSEQEAMSTLLSAVEAAEFRDVNAAKAYQHAPRPSSNHAGGVNVVMCDGSGKFLSESMDKGVYVKLISSNGVSFGERALNQAAY